MESVNQGHCELGEENLDFILGIVDCYGVDDDGNDNSNDILMTMDEEGDDDVFENVLINNSCNLGPNATSKQPHVCNNQNNAFSLSPSIATSNTGNSVLIPNNENKENSDIRLAVDRNNNSSGYSVNNIFINNNTFVNNNNNNIINYPHVGSNNTGSVSSTCTYNDGGINSPCPKVYHDLQCNTVVPMTTTTTTTISNNNNNNDVNNGPIDWSNFGDLSLPHNPCLFPSDGSNSICSGDQNNNINFNHGLKHDDNKAQPFHWYQIQRSDDCGSRSCSSTSTIRHTSSSSSVGSNSSSNCGSILNGGSCCGNNSSGSSISGSSVHDNSGSNSSRNSSCSSYNGAFANTPSTTATPPPAPATSYNNSSFGNSSNNNNNKDNNNKKSSISEDCCISTRGNCNNKNKNSNRRSTNKKKNITTTTITTQEDNNSSNIDSNSKEVMMSAYMEACRSGQLTPILKEELKFFIQARRLSQGKEEMEVQFTPPSPSQLSAKEMEKIERRKKQNRQAAKRFRQKQKSCEDLLLQKIKELENKNTSLFEEAQVLRGEKQKLMEVIAEHLLVCPFFSLKSPLFPEGELSAAEQNADS